MKSAVCSALDISGQGEAKIVKTAYKLAWLSSFCCVLLTGCSVPRVGKHSFHRCQYPVSGWPLHPREDFFALFVLCLLFTYFYNTIEDVMIISNYSATVRRLYLMSNFIEVHLDDITTLYLETTEDDIQKAEGGLFTPDLHTSQEHLSVPHTPVRPHAM